MFDAMTQTWWRIGQAVIWIFSRDARVVRHLCGHDGTSFEASAVDFFEENKATIVPRFKEISWAADALIEEAVAGRIAATGVAEGEGDRKPIPAEHWVELALDWDLDWARATQSPGATRWKKPMFRRSDVMAAFPVVISPARKAERLAARVEEWLGRDRNELSVIVNLASGRPPIALPIDQPPELIRLRALKDAVDGGSLPAFKRGQTANVMTSVALADLLAFVQSRRNDSNWDWLMEFCRRWGKSRGLPDDAFEAGSRTAGTIRGETECQKWLIDEMAKKAAPDHPKPHFAAHAVKQFKIGRRAFDRAWNSAIGSTNAVGWRKPGRKSKRRIDSLNKS